jgi:hypothetical protein
VACTGVKKTAYGILVGKARRIETTRKTNHRWWKYNIRRDLREV